MSVRVKFLFINFVSRTNIILSKEIIFKVYNFAIAASAQRSPSMAAETIPPA